MAVIKAVIDTGVMVGVAFAGEGLARNNFTGSRSSMSRNF
jgi:hypothetical protein